MAEHRGQDRGARQLGQIEFVAAVRLWRDQLDPDVGQDRGYGPPHVVVSPHDVRNQQRVGPVYGRPGRLVTAQPYGLPRVENPGAVPLQERGGQADLAGRLIIVTMR